MIRMSNAAGTRFALAIALTTLPALAAAQAFPAKPVRILLASAAGSGEDVVARALAQELAASSWKPGTFVENRVGAAGFIAAEAAAKSPADGHTLFLGSAGIMAVNPHLYPTIPYDAIKDFVPVAFLGSYPMVLVVGQKTNAKTLAELVQVMKQKGAKATTYASYGPGSLTNIAPQMLRLASGTTVENIQFKGAGDAVPNVVNGEIDMMFESATTIEGYVKSGKLRALGVTSTRRLDTLPDVPTFEEAGYKPFEVIQWSALFAPANVPKDVVAKLTTDVTAAANAKDVRERLLRVGIQPMPAMSPAEAQTFHRAQYEKYGRAIRDLEIKIE
jgi:tripartite-type tricarboxylate transporter receptor subunit TctC